MSQSGSKASHTHTHYISLSWFSYASSILVKLEFGDVAFCGRRRETREPGEKPSGQRKNRQQTQPTCGTGLESNPTQAILLGGKCSQHEPSFLTSLRTVQIIFFVYH